MARVHLFEFEDQSWFPECIRNYGTDFLQFLSNKAKIYHTVLPELVEAMQKSGQHNIVDLASGGGGPWESLIPELTKHFSGLRITLTDFYPNLRAMKRMSDEFDAVDYFEEPLDARDVPEELKGIRTQFLSLHHFRPEQAKAILSNAAETGNALAIFEAQERSLPSILAMLFSPISVLFTTPFIRPFSWGRLLFTYIIPIVPLFVMWDGVVSSLRTYSVKEMEAMVRELPERESMEWNISKVKSGPGVVLYLIAVPVQEMAEC